MLLSADGDSRTDVVRTESGLGGGENPSERMAPLSSRKSLPDDRRKFAPDFFIVGAPKAGTTSLFAYLRDHPAVGAASEKEPYHFCRDLGDIAKVKDDAGYEALFGGAPARSLLGEASVWYLYSTGAVPEILAQNPAAKFIVIVRNPADMAYALHNQFVRTLQEDIDDFREAWEAQDARARGLRLPRYCPAPSLLQYRRVCALGEQTSRLLEVTPPESTLLCRTDELARDPAALYARVLEFLGLSDDGRREFPVVNESRRWRSERLVRLLREPPLGVDWMIDTAKSYANRRGVRPLRYLRPLATRPAPKEPLDPSLRERILGELGADTSLLESVTGWTLKEWR